MAQHPQNSCHPAISVTKRLRNLMPKVKWSFQGLSCNLGICIKSKYPGNSKVNTQFQVFTFGVLTFLPTGILPILIRIFAKFHVILQILEAKLETMQENLEGVYLKVFTLSVKMKRLSSDQSYIGL